MGVTTEQFKQSASAVLWACTHTTEQGYRNQPLATLFFTGMTVAFTLSAIGFDTDWSYLSVGAAVTMGVVATWHIMRSMFKGRIMLSYDKFTAEAHERPIPNWLLTIWGLRSTLHQTVAFTHPNLTPETIWKLTPKTTTNVMLFPKTVLMLLADNPKTPLKSLRAVWLGTKHIDLSSGFYYRGRLTEHPNMTTEFLEETFLHDSLGLDPRTIASTTRITPTIARLIINLPVPCSSLYGPVGDREKTEALIRLALNHHLPDEISVELATHKNQRVREMLCRNSTVSARVKALAAVSTETVPYY